MFVWCPLLPAWSLLSWIKLGYNLCFIFWELEPTKFGRKYHRQVYRTRTTAKARLKKQNKIENNYDFDFSPHCVCVWRDPSRFRPQLNLNEVRIFGAFHKRQTERVALCYTPITCASPSSNICYYQYSTVGMKCRQLLYFP